MMQKLKAYWTSHGTKALGAVTAFVGSIQASIVTGLMEVPKGYKNAVAVAVIALGAATVKRGFTNSANAPKP